MGRRSFSAKDRLRIFTAHKGVCHLCSGLITVGEAWEVEHVIAYALTRDNSDENLRPAHKRCHEIKTRQEDVPAIAKAERREAKHTGASRPKQQIRSAGFPKPPPKERKPMLPPRRIYAMWPAGQSEEARDGTD